MSEVRYINLNEMQKRVDEANRKKAEESMALRQADLDKELKESEELQRLWAQSLRESRIEDEQKQQNEIDKQLATRKRELESVRGRKTIAQEEKEKEKYRNMLAGNLFDD